MFCSICALCSNCNRGYACTMCKRTVWDATATFENAESFKMELYYHYFLLVICYYGYISLVFTTIAT